MVRSIIVALLVIQTCALGAWYDKKLPTWIDGSETYRSGGEAMFIGMVAPTIISEAWQHKYPTSSRQKQIGRVFTAHVAVLTFTALLFMGDKALHDGDARLQNPIAVAGVSVPLNIIWSCVRPMPKKRILNAKPN